MARTAAGFALLVAIIFVFCGVEFSHAQASDSEKAVYADALAYCRGDVSHPEALRADGRVLCLDGWNFATNNIWLANGLEHGGISVVRSLDGDAYGAMLLANLLRIKEATVVINDYCVATCANYLFASAAKTFVPKDALVAWTVWASIEGYCIEFSETSDPRAPRLGQGPCSGASAYADTRNDGPIRRSYGGRGMTGPEQPPESVFVRKILKHKFDQTGKYPIGVYWTSNPRYSASSIRTQVVYEAYPQSQEQLDAIVKELHLPFPVIWDQ